MSHKSLFILGRQPELGRAELESLFGAENVEPIGDHAMACSVPVDDIPFSRLGGSVRLAAPLTVLETTDWREIGRKLTAQLPTYLDSLPDKGKIKLGLSAFDVRVNAKQLVAMGLELKKICRQTGRSVRVVPNTEPELGSAQVLHNQLTGPLGLELLLIRHGHQTYVAQTKLVQNIEAYAHRDQGRPKRDARVGMLPPKLAQIIVNLAAGDTNPAHGPILLDPFCGTGVILQEALLMGFDIYGTDLEPRMIDYTIRNLDWLRTQELYQQQKHANLFDKVEVGDAATHEWQPQPQIIACETYLGRPFSTAPATDVLSQVISDVNTILTKFLQNVARQTEPGLRICIAVPAWAVGGSFKHLPFLDHLGEMGYNRVSFEHAGATELVYYRPGQVVARELLVITRK